MSNKIPESDSAPDPAPSRTRRTRRAPEQRLQEIRAVAAEAFATLPWDAVSLEEIARAVGVSKGLVYHYFPGKSALLAAVIEHDSILEATRPDESRPASERGVASLDAYFAYARANRLLYLSMMRHGRLLEASIGTRIDANQATQRQRMLATLRATGATGVDEARLDPVLEAWQAFLITSTLHWLEAELPTAPDAPPPREICSAVFVAALRAAGVRFRTPRAGKAPARAAR